MDTRAYMPASKSTDYETPHDLFDRLDKEFGPFTLDPCGQREHHSVCRVMDNGGHFYDGSTGAMDGLLQPWDGRVFMNPEYGRAMLRWVEKAVDEVGCGNAELVVALIPARTDTRMWQRLVLTSVHRIDCGDGAFIDRAAMVAREVRFLPGRLKFGGAKDSAPFPSAVVVWRNDA
ncbi:hypothetical protein LCGC14_0935460 [marine sediment metagenome]|uniref:DNA N-6-adenine-methyltransferase (Dam) n=1 Tax=marine sediment metagenome TaxID=412755 RepID=A0A0F9NLS4_9ZZZZ